jgi:hypothetical protein
MEMNISITARHGAGEREDIAVVVKELRSENRHAADGKIVKLLIGRMRESDSTLRAAAEWIVENARAAERKQEHRPQRRSTPPAHKELEREQTKRIVDQTVKKVVLLSMICINNKELRCCSGREVSAMGPLFRRVATRLKPDELVGTVFSEQDLCELMT